MVDVIKLYMDEHVPMAVTKALRRRGIDVIRAQDVGNHPADDLVHLEFATKDGRVVMTQDVDFIRLHSAGTHHAGIAYATQQTPVGYARSHADSPGGRRTTCGDDRSRRVSLDTRSGQLGHAS